MCNGLFHGGIDYYLPIFGMCNGSFHGEVNGIDYSLPVDYCLPIWPKVLTSKWLCRQGRIVLRESRHQVFQFN